MLVDRKQPYEEFFVSKICQTIFDITGTRMKQIDQYNEAGKSMTIQSWFYEQHNKMYLYYELNEYLMNMSTPEVLYTAINKSLIGDYHKYFGGYLEILGPSVEYSRNSINSLKNRRIFMINTRLSPATFAYWKLKQNNTYYFLEDSFITMMDYYNYFLEYPNTRKVDPILRQFYDQIMNWTKYYFEKGPIAPGDDWDFDGLRADADLKYKDYKMIDGALSVETSVGLPYLMVNGMNGTVTDPFGNEIAIDEAFKMYSTIYEKIFNRKLRKIEDDELLIIYLDVIS